MIPVYNGFIGQGNVAGNDDLHFFLYPQLAGTGGRLFLVELYFDAGIDHAFFVLPDHLLYRMDNGLFLLIGIADIIEIGIPDAAAKITVGRKAIKGRSEDQVQVVCHRLF